MKSNINIDFIYGIHAVTNLLVADSSRIKKVIIQKDLDNNKIQKIIELVSKNRVEIS